MSMARLGVIILFIIASACQNEKTQPNTIAFKTLDTDFSKGRLGLEQEIVLEDLVKFHGHLCDGLVVGAMALDTVFQQLYPNQPVDRTNLRIVSKPSPCLTDVAIYLTGGRYQFNTFYTDTDFDGLFIIQRIDDGKTLIVDLAKDVKPSAIDSLGNIAIAQELPPCDIDKLKALEDDFTDFLLQSHTTGTPLFSVQVHPNFIWTPNTKNDYLKTDVLNKHLPSCNHD